MWAVSKAFSAGLNIIIITELRFNIFFHKYVLNHSQQYLLFVT